MNAGGDEFANNNVEFIHAKCTGGSPIIITIVTSKTVDGLAIADRTVTVPVNEDRMIGPFDKSIYNDANGSVQLAYSDPDGGTIAIIAPGSSS